MPFRKRNAVLWSTAIVVKKFQASYLKKKQY